MKGNYLLKSNWRKEMINGNPNPSGNIPDEPSIHTQTPAESIRPINQQQNKQINQNELNTDILPIKRTDESMNSPINIQIETNNQRENEEARTPKKEDDQVANAQGV